jgi:membrane peptidoglycan carboxypeptidase
VQQAFIVAVDPTFDVSGTTRSREQGNILPRQLVHQIHLLGTGLRDEAREMVMVPVLEQRASKAEIFELYLNRIYLGIDENVEIYGIYDAAREYFGKEPSDLTVSEAATLAGLLLPPKIDRPEDRPGAVGVRRNEVLGALLTSGVITSDDYAAAVRERLGFQPGINELPMSRRLPSPSDTVTIRLPPQYRPQPEPPEESERTR